MLDWVGKSYREVGNCWAFARTILMEMGRSLPEEPFVRGGKRQEASFQAWREKFTEHERPAANQLVLFKIPRGRKAVECYPFRYHCGVMLDEFKFIHADRDMGVVISRLSNDMFRPFVVGYFTYGS